MSLPQKQNIDQWLAENEKHLEPPVMNKLMYGAGQLKVMYVGGPNIRSDYHLEEGEELFYMQKGSMVVKVIEHGKFVDVPIEEGEMFLLPGRIPHSPQRFEGTIGLVIERERAKNELDCLRWYIPDSEEPKSLYESFFWCEDLGVQLKPVIAAFYASEQKKTGKPLPGTILDDSQAPIVPDKTKKLPAKIPLKKWISEHELSIASSASGFAPISDSGEFKVICYAGSNSNSLIHLHHHGEAWIWQWKGKSTVQTFEPVSPPSSGASSTPTSASHSINLKESDIEVQKPTSTHSMTLQDSHLIQVHTPYRITHDHDSVLIVVLIVPQFHSK